jgi:hypothetical protein
MQDILMEESQHKRVAKQGHLRPKPTSYITDIEIFAARRVHDGRYVVPISTWRTTERVAGPRHGGTDLSEKGLSSLEK